MSCLPGASSLAVKTVNRQILSNNLLKNRELTECLRREGAGGGRSTAERLVPRFTLRLLGSGLVPRSWAPLLTPHGFWPATSSSEIQLHHLSNKDSTAPASEEWLWASDIRRGVNTADGQ